MSHTHRTLKHAVHLVVLSLLTALCFAFSAGATQPGTITGDGVNLRSEPNTESQEVDVLNTGDTVSILDTSIEGWIKVSHATSDDIVVGYVSADLVEVGVETNETALVNNAGVTQTATISGGEVRLRQEPNTDSSILTLLEEGAVVTILDDTIDGWIKASYSNSDGSFVGFISSDYLFTNPMATGVTARNSIILRQEQSNTSPIVAILSSNSELDILDTLDGWYEVSSNGIVGYVQRELVSTENDSQCIGYATVTADALYLRSSPSTEADILTSLPTGVSFQITSNDTEGWYGAIFNGQSGYVSSDYITFSESLSSGYVQVTADVLSLRAGAGTDFAKLKVIPEGTLLTVSGTYGSWFQVTYDGYTGYVSGAYVSSTTEEGYQYYPDFVKVTGDGLSLRKESSTEGELMANIDEGVIVEVVDKDGDWFKVKYDGQVGYINGAYTVESDGPATVIVHESASSGSSGNRTSSSNSSSSSYEGGSTVSGGTGSAVADYACQFLGNPYVWGGTSLTNGCDCSGFVMQVYAHFGYTSLPHSSSAQRNYGQAVSLENIQPGDIVCYNHHVGIYVGNGKIISALGRNYGITYSSVTYKSIITIRRIFS